MLFRGIRILTGFSGLGFRGLRLSGVYGFGA